MDDKPTSEPEKITINNADNDVEEVPPKPSRNKNWSWEDSYELLRLVNKHGKTWSKVLEEFQREHRATQVKDPKELRVRFNTLNSKQSCLYKEYHTPKLVIPNRRNLTQAEIARLEQDHALKHEICRKEYDTARSWLKNIQQREEKRATTNPKSTVEEIQSELVASGKKRTEEIKSRQEELKQVALTEQAHRVKVDGVIEMVANVLTGVQQSEQQILSLFQEYIALKKQKL